MKKIGIIFVCFVFILLGIVLVNETKIIETSAVNTNGFASIKTNTCYLYRHNVIDSGLDNKYFLLEKSYFVKIIENVDEVFYKVEYSNIYGYVKKDEVELVEEVPICPYLEDITFDIYSASSVQLRLEPTTKNGIGSVIYSLPSQTKKLKYYGRITGEESIIGLGNIWYFCSTIIDNKEVFGYVYSPYTINLSPILESNESLTSVSATNFIPMNNLLYLNLSSKSLIIIFVSIPTLFLIYLFIKPTKILKN